MMAEIVLKFKRFVVICNHYIANECIVSTPSGINTTTWATLDKQSVGYT